MQIVVQDVKILTDETELLHTNITDWTQYLHQTEWINNQHLRNITSQYVDVAQQLNNVTSQYSTISTQLQQVNQTIINDIIKRYNNTIQMVNADANAVQSAINNARNQ